MVPESLEEHPSSEWRKLQGLDIDVNLVLMPCVGSDEVRYYESEGTVEIEQE
jgi:hypothetical protein